MSQWQSPSTPPPYPGQGYEGQQQQQSYPQYQQQQQQPPIYQPPVQQPPSKRPSRKGFWIGGIIGGFLAIIIIVVIAAQMGGSSTPGQTPGTTQSTQQGQQQPTQPATSQPTPTIGKPYVVNDTWTVTLNSVKTSTGTEFDKPKAGDILLVVNVTLKNTSSQALVASSLIMFSIKDATGQTYNQDIVYGSSPDGNVSSQSLIRGDIAYEVPLSQHKFTFQFVPALGSTDLAEWTLSI